MKEEPSIAVKYKNLYQKMGVSDEERERLETMRFKAMVQRLMFVSKITLGGGTIHNVNHKATAKRRAANKVARKQRRVNRG